MDEELSHLFLLQPPLWVQKTSALSHANGLIGQGVQLRQRRRLAHEYGGLCTPSFPQISKMGEANWIQEM